MMKHVGLRNIVSLISTKHLEMVGKQLFLSPSAAMKWTGSL